MTMSWLSAQYSITTFCCFKSFCLYSQLCSATEVLQVRAAACAFSIVTFCADRAEIREQAVPALAVETAEKRAAPALAVKNQNTKDVRRELVSRHDCTILFTFHKMLNSPTFRYAVNRHGKSVQTAK